jgi:hypothetical protein
MTGMPRIALLPVGYPDRHALDNLARDLKGISLDVERAGRRALPRGAFDTRRGQFHADALLGVAVSVRAERACSPSPTWTSTPMILRRSGLRHVVQLYP